MIAVGDDPGGHPIRLPLGAALATAKTTRLITGWKLEVIRLVVPAGKEIAPHRAKGEATVQCLEGRVAFTTNEGVHELEPGSLLHLQPDVLHGVIGIEDASLLVTVVTFHGEGVAGSP